MIEITITIKKETLNEGLDVLTEISLGTDDPDIVRQCEEIRASLSEGGEQISGEGKEVLQRLTAKRGSCRDLREQESDGVFEGE